MVGRIRLTDSEASEFKPRGRSKPKQGKRRRVSASSTELVRITDKNGIDRPKRKATDKQRSGAEVDRIVKRIAFMMVTKDPEALPQVLWKGMLSRKQLAEEYGVSPSMIAQWTERASALVRLGDDRDLYAMKSRLLIELESIREIALESADASLPQYRGSLYRAAIDSVAEQSKIAGVNRSDATTTNVAIQVNHGTQDGLPPEVRMLVESASGGDVEAQGRLMLWRATGMLNANDEAREAVRELARLVGLRVEDVDVIDVPALTSGDDGEEPELS